MASIEALKLKATETKDQAVVVLHNMKSKAEETKDKAVVLVRNPRFQSYTIATAGGAITFGSAGGAFGLASGIVVGSAAGVVPALFTFGLSIPAGAVIGGIGGLCTGTLIGSTAGGIGGFTTYKYRVEIKDGLMVVKVKAQDSVTTTKEKTAMVLNSAREHVVAHLNFVRVSVSSVADRAITKSNAAVSFTKGQASDAVSFATTTKVGVTSSSAVAGAVVGGTTTGAFGTVAGAAVGLVPAIFTFGLSIPVGAVVGLCVGTTVGGSAGAVGGGAIGYGGFTHRKAISEGFESSRSKVSSKAHELKTSAFTRAADAKESMRSLIKGSTGGSARY